MKCSQLCALLIGGPGDLPAGRIVSAGSRQILRFGTAIIQSLRHWQSKVDLVLRGAYGREHRARGNGSARLPLGNTRNFTESRPHSAGNFFQDRAIPGRSRNAGHQWRTHRAVSALLPTPVHDEICGLGRL